MTIFLDEIAGEPDPIQQRRLARKLLRKIERNEWFAVRHEELKTACSNEVGDWQTSFHADRFARTYRSIMGFLPSERDGVKRRLQEIVCSH